jgi:2'-hydroxyisoflavone reductase
MKRRAFIAAVGAAAAAAGWADTRRKKTLQILILGGTRFLGVHMTELALQRRHSVTFFNRGRTRSELFPQIERIKGDRDGDIEGLKGRKWDAVIDNSGYVPRHVRLTAEALAPHVQQYLFVSSISVYPDFSVPRTEDSPVGKLGDESLEKVDGETYGPLKALCEQAAERAMPGRTTVLRPGLIVGPDDNTDRFTYWPARAARGGEMLAPNARTDRIQIIDARDLARFALDVLEKRIVGIFNVVSPPDRFTMGELLDASTSAARSLAKPQEPPQPVWVPAAFLEEHKVEGWSDLPVWVHATGEEAGFADTSAERAVHAGLAVSPLERTVRDTLAWHLKRPPGEQEKLKAGITREREREVLAAWKAQQGNSQDS